MTVVNTVARRAVVLLLIAALVLSVGPGLAAAETRSDGTVVIDADETIDDDLEAFGGTVVVHGTVNGDLDVFAGNVFIDGTVNGDVEAFSGNVRVDGRVAGDVSAVGGNVEIGPEASVGGSLEAAAGSVTVLGTVDGDARLGGETVRLGPAAVIGGNVEYDADEFVRDEGATVAGTVRRNPDLSVGPSFDGAVPAVPSVALGVYGFLVNLLLGAVLLVVFPRFSAGVAERALDEPLRTGGVGLLAFVVAPVVLVLTAITIVGLPLSLVGAVVLAVAAWVGAVYGRFVVGTWLVSLADYDNRWVGLVVGFVAVAIAIRIPFVGWLVSIAVFLLGFGALVHGLYVAYRGGSGPAVEPGPEGPAETGEGGRPA